MKVEDEATCFDSTKSSCVSKTRISSLKPDRVVLEIILHTFTLSNESPGIEELTAVSGEDESVSAAQIWMLPNVQFKSLWDSLFYEDDLKWRLVRYVETMLLFSDRNIDQNIVTYNRVVLLHGPPGAMIAFSVFFFNFTEIVRLVVIVFTLIKLFCKTLLMSLQL